LDVPKQNSQNEKRPTKETFIYMKRDVERERNNWMSLSKAARVSYINRDP